MFSKKSKKSIIELRRCNCGNCQSTAEFNPNEICEICNGKIPLEEAKKMIEEDQELMKRINLSNVKTKMKTQQQFLKQTIDELKKGMRPNYIAPLL